MKTLTLPIIDLIIMGGVLLAADKAPEPAPKPPEKHAPKDKDAVIEYWKIVSDYNGQSAAYQNSLTANQKNILSRMDEIQKKAVEQLNKLCGTDEKVDSSGPDPVCVAKPAEEAPKPDKK